MASRSGTPASSSYVGEGSGQQAAAAEGVTVAVAPPPSAPQPEPIPVAVEDHDEEMVEGGVPDAPPPLEAPENVPPPQPEGGQAAGGVQGNFACDICGARYATEKAMFGHLRCHKDRGWRGAFSPPTFTMEEFAEYQEHLVKSEEEQLREIAEEEAALNLPPPPPAAVRARVEAGESSGKVVLDVDLNVEVEAVEDFTLPDLNLPPPDAE